MFDPVRLFKKRMTDHIKLLNRYLRYISNGHFMIALFFLIVTLSVYYQKWLETLSPNFPVNLVIALALGLVASYNPIQMFLKEPDKVYLIVKEKEMVRYFRLTLLYNYIVQLYLVFLVMGALFPLYSTAYPDKQSTDYLLLFVVLVIVKAWNMVTNWWMFKIRHAANRTFDKILRTALSIALFYFLLVGEFFIIVAILYFIVIINDYIYSKKQFGLAWDVLIDNDQHRLALFYRFASMFANVPQAKKYLKKRRIWAKLVNQYIPFQHEKTYDYLYRLTFFRSTDYFNMYVRLIVVGSIVILFVGNVWVKIALAILFLYMTNFQMVTLYYHHRTNMWLDLYPIENMRKEKAFIKWLTQLTLVQTIIFAALFLIWMDFFSLLITFVGGCIFNYLFNNMYVKRKIESSSI